MITFLEVKRTCGGSDRMWAKIRGVQSDEKPLTYANGSEFFEMDTRKTFYFNEVTNSWIDADAPLVTSIAISTPPTKTEYIEGQTFDATGAKITLTLSDESTRTLDATCSLDRPLTLADADVLLECVFNGATYGALQVIEVSAKAVATIEVSHAPDKTVYKEGQTLTMKGMKLYVTYNDESTTRISYDAPGITYEPREDTEITQNTTVLITYGGKTCTQDVTFDSGE